MSWEDVLIRESVGDGTIDPDDVCMVCDKRDCVCPEEDGETLTSVVYDRATMAYLPVDPFTKSKFTPARKEAP